MATVSLPQLANADNAEDARAAFARKDYETAIRLWDKLSQSGDADAQYMLGSLYLHGIGTEQNVTQGLSLIESAANAGNAEAQDALGGIYYAGRFVPRSRELSNYWLEKAANLGYGPAQVTFGMYLSLSKAPADRIAALMWLELAVQLLGEKAPEYNLAVSHRNNVIADMTPDEVALAEAAARRWLEDHAQQKL